MEIEKKFRVEDAASFARLDDLKMLGSYTLRHISQPEQQHNTYYDTADRLLEASRHGLRIRQIDGRCIATLKGPGESAGGLFRRGEWEVEACDAHPSTWPESEARTQALKLLGDAPLLPLLTIQTQRRHIMAARDNEEVAELSLDEGTIYSGGQSERFCELEIELLPAGSERDLEALEAALHEHLLLIPEHRSKLERGLSLLRARQQA